MASNHQSNGILPDRKAAGVWKWSSTSIPSVMTKNISIHSLSSQKKVNNINVSIHIFEGACLHRVSQLKVGMNLFPFPKLYAWLLNNYTLQVTYTASSHSVATAVTRQGVLRGTYVYLHCMPWASLGDVLSSICTITITTNIHINVVAVGIKNLNIKRCWSCTPCVNCKLCPLALVHSITLHTRTKALNLYQHWKDFTLEKYKHDEHTESLIIQKLFKKSLTFYLVNKNVDITCNELQANL